MSPLKTFKILFRTSPVARTLTWIGVVFFGTVIFGLFKCNFARRPQVNSIEPLIGAPGDTMVISGNYFGDTRGFSYVEIAGSKVTATGYLEWSDKEIKLVIPPNVQDGLVFVGTTSGRSAPSFFANEVGIPVAVREDATSSAPIIMSFSPEKASVGQIISIRGMNFGSARGNSRVCFTANRVESRLSEKNPAQDDAEGAYIDASVQDMDYESWTDSEIRVRIPDGADSGSFYVETSRGTSSSKKIALEFPCGKKEYSNRRTYVIQVSADISNHVASQESTIMFYIPKPARSSFQPYASLNECNPEPFIADDPYDIIHNKQLNQIVNNKQRFGQTFVVSVYSVKSNINGKAVSLYKDKDSLLYMGGTAEDPCVPAKDSAVLALLNATAATVRSPYEKARILYNYMIENYRLLEKLRSGDVAVSDLIKHKKGDAYDFAILYTALCRAAGIPAMPVAGILVGQHSTAKPHWWTEIYFEGYGWFPVDVPLGAGLEFEPFVPVENPAEFYFGNIDSQHVAFSRGWRQIRQSAHNTKIVYRPRTYALQSIWEEAGDETSSYSSLWNNPSVIGIY